LLASVGNLTRYFSQEIGKEPFSMRLDYVSAAAFILYGVGIGLPIFLTLLMKFFGSVV
jgi:hypothetical protein